MNLVACGSATRGADQVVRSVDELLNSRIVEASTPASAQLVEMRASRRS